MERVARDIKAHLHGDGFTTEDMRPSWFHIRSDFGVAFRGLRVMHIGIEEDNEFGWARVDFSLLEGLRVVSTPALSTRWKRSNRSHSRHGFRIGSDNLQQRDAAGREKSLGRLVRKAIYIIEDVTRDLLVCDIGLHNFRYWGTAREIDLVFGHKAVPSELATHVMSFL